MLQKSAAVGVAKKKKNRSLGGLLKVVEIVEGGSAKEDNSIRSAAVSKQLVERCEKQVSKYVQVMISSPLKSSIFAGCSLIYSKFVETTRTFNKKRSVLTFTCFLAMSGFTIV